MKALLFRLGVCDSLLTDLGLDTGAAVDLLGLATGTAVDLLGLVKSIVVGLLGLDAGTVFVLRAKKVWMPVVIPSLPYMFCFVFVAYTLAVLNELNFAPSGAIQLE